MQKFRVILLLTILLTTLFSKEVRSPLASGLWTLSNSPYQIFNDIEVPDDSTLVIEPGVVVEFQDNYKMTVYGSIVAEGTENNLIKFTVSDTTGFAITSIPDGGWGGIRLDYMPIAIREDSSKFEYCHFEYGKGNYTTSYGGAIYIDTFSKVKIKNNMFDHNKAFLGSGIYIHESDIEITNNTFTNNYSFAGGGIYYDVSLNYAKVLNNKFINNIAESSNPNYGGGGLYINLLRNPEISNNQFIENGSITGLAIHVYNSLDTIVMHNNFFYNNYHLNNLNGYALFGRDTDLIVRNSKFIENTGGVFIIEGNTIFENCLFNGNYRNGAIRLGTLVSVGIFPVGYPEINNCTIVNNHAIERSGGVESIQLTLYSNNSIYYNNTSDEHLYQIVSTLNDAYIVNCNVQNLDYSMTYLEDNNFINCIDVDPQFVLSGDEPYSLSGNSPCVNAGVNEFSWSHNATFPETDILGNPRIHDGYADIGAYEYQGVGIEDNSFIKEYSLFRNYPNPFNPETTIEFSLPKQEYIELSVYNISGEEVATLYNGIKSAGVHKINFDATGLTSGIYYYQLISRDKILNSNRMVLLK